MWREKAFAQTMNTMIMSIEMNNLKLIRLFLMNYFCTSLLTKPKYWFT